MILDYTNDIYYSIVSGARTEIKVKGSRFIASVEPVESKEDAIKFLESIRSEYFSATHNCFAYLLGFNGLLFRSSDDGEPSGSAGKPILFSIKKFNYSDIIVVVTRYFGGTKLGVGGLARAYSEAAEKVLTMCERKPVYRTMPVRVHCVYEDLNIIKKLIDTYAVDFKEDYSDSVEIVSNIPISKVDEFISLVQNSTNTRAGAILLKNL